MNKYLLFKLIGIIYLIPIYGQEYNTSSFYNLFDASLDSTISCYRIPAFVTSPNGTLIATIDERVPNCSDLKWSRDINIVQRRSIDGGKSWLPIERIIDFPDGKSASDPSMIVDEEIGRVFLFYNYMDHDKEKDVYYFHVMHTDDDGATWSQPKDITPEVSPETWHGDFKFITSGRGIQTSDGRLLHTMVNLDKGLHVFGSDDHGDSWYLIDTPITPADESKIIELQDGSWMINSRVAKAEKRYIHISSDEGENWDTYADDSLIDPACNASILYYKTDDTSDQDILLFSNAYDKKERRNLTLHMSLDQGKTWSKRNTIYKGSAAYSSLTILPNGDVGVFFEKDDYGKIVFTIIPLDEMVKSN